MRKRVSVLLTDGFADWEAAYVLGVGGSFYGLDTQCISPGGANVTSQGGVHVAPHGSLEAFEGRWDDVLLVCGGLHWQRPDAIDIAGVSRASLAAGGTLAAICGGTLALAKAGVLQGQRHTSNDRSFLADNAPGYAGHECYEDSAVAVVDGAVITAPGTAPATFSAAVFRAAGLDERTISQFLDMMRAEFRA